MTDPSIFWGHQWTAIPRGWKKDRAKLRQLANGDWLLTLSWSDREDVGKTKEEALERRFGPPVLIGRSAWYLWDKNNYYHAAPNVHPVVQRIGYWEVPPYGEHYSSMEQACRAAIQISLDSSAFIVQAALWKAKQIREVLRQMESSPDA